MRIRRVSSTLFFIHLFTFPILFCIGFRAFLFGTGFCFVRSTSNQELSKFEKFISDIATFDTIKLESSWLFWVICIIFNIAFINILAYYYNQHISDLRNYKEYLLYNSDSESEPDETDTLKYLEDKISSSYHSYNNVVENTTGIIAIGSLVPLLSALSYSIFLN